MLTRTIMRLSLPLLFALTLACSILPSSKRSALTKEELVRLADKEVYIIDGEKYIKVPAQGNEKENRKFRYIKVERYLAGEIESLPLEAERIKRKEATGLEKAKQEQAKEPEPKKPLPLVSRPLKYPYLKRKIAVLPFEDHTKFTYERFGQIIAERLAKKMEIKLFSSLVMDRGVVALSLEKLDLSPQDLKDPSKSTLLNETLGIQGIIRGKVYGPFVTCSASAQSEKSAMAIVRIEVQFIDAAHGRIMKEFAAGNPLAESREIGALSEEKAKYRAVDLAIDQILTEVAEELNGMDWFGRIALVEGKMVYLNAGYQTGLKEGDLLEVYPAGDLGSTKPIGRIKVSRLFGVDASVAQVIEGSGFQVNDLVRPLPQS